MRSRQIRVRGVVQGVGFRPNAWRLAKQCGLVGDVCNDGEGVLIRAWGDAGSLDEFARRLRTEAPLLARIDSVEIDDMPLRGAVPPAFAIVASRRGNVRTAIVADAAACTECLADIAAAGNRRHRYAFTNCTHCGPRLSIVQTLPYDRRRTTMHAFAMCAACKAEYADPADRRFHAQPTACPDCGPRLWLEDAAGRTLASDPDTAFSQARQAIDAGRIVAIKGLGGYQLACDALDADAVARLRQRKRRHDKPLALMARDVTMVQRYCEVSAEARKLLSSAAAPIVVLPATDSEKVAPQVAPAVGSLGFMLPNTPLHHLLLAGLDRPIVLTSGNVSDEPQCTEDGDARRRLEPIADLLLVHDRGIANRIDDSVVRVVAGQARVLRRARGYAPAPIALPRGFERAPALLAMGGELKNTFCIVADGQATVSQHIGDLESAAAYVDYKKQLDLYASMFEHEPTLIAVDRHPEYLSSKHGRELAEAGGTRLEGVQHHHAHVAACLAENGRPLDAPAVLGVVLDGLGWGSDGEIWGGEFLLADYRGFERLARLKPVPMIGGAQAIREPWRNTYAHLLEAVGWAGFERELGGHELHRFLAGRPRAALDSMLDARINCPAASSCGRLFDAVAAALDVCRERAGYEGQAAVELEALAERASPDAAHAGYPFAMSSAATSAAMSDAAADAASGPAEALVELDPAPMWRALLADLGRAVPREAVALRFHRGLAHAVTRMVRRLAGSPHARRFDTVALSGGVFQNALLLELVLDELRASDFEVLTHRRVPSNDGGLSLGQAAVAAARALHRSEGGMARDIEAQPAPPVTVAASRKEPACA